MSALRERHRLDKQARIQQAALDLFTAQGFEATTLRQIAQQADIAVGTIFLYVTDKSDLLIMVFHHALQETLQEALSTPLPGRTPVETMFSLFNRLFDLYLPRQTLALDFIRVIMFHPSPWQRRELEQAEHFVQHLSRILQDQQSSGVLRQDLDPGLTASTLFTLYQGALVKWLCGHLAQQEALQLLNRQLSVLLGEERP